MPKKDRRLENVILLIVVIAALAGVWYMYQASVGRAFLQAPTFVVRQTTTEFCCCQTAQGKLFEVFGAVAKDADEFKKAEVCKNLCEVEHSTVRHPSVLIGPGKCGLYT